MRFNSKELAYFATRCSTSSGSNVDKEGILFLKEKPEGLFKKGEVYIERWCILRGNILFYFKSRERHSEPVGAIVLERCCVELDLNEELPYSFQLVFEGDERIRYLAALSEEDRDTWIEALHIASYECLKMQLECLREQIKSKTGRDPIDQPLPSELDGATPDDQEGTVIELCLKCVELPLGPQGLEPCPMVIISTITPPQQSWCIFTHTETIERCSNPVFMKTICINWKSISGATRVKLSVYDVKERLTETMAQIGSVIFTMGDLIRAKTHALELSLGPSCGSIHVTAWQEDSALDVLSDDTTSPTDSTPETPNGKFGDLSLSTIDSRDLPAEVGSPVPVTSKASSRTQLLRPLYDNITTRTYRFPSNHGMELKVFEYMGESKLAFHIPRELLKLWIEEEKVRMTQLQDLGSLPEEWDNVRTQLQNLHMAITNAYTQSLRYLKEYKGPPFKQSCKRLVKELEFIPINLHIQRLWVTNDITNTIAPSFSGEFYDTTTVGAFAAFPLKFKHGGLRKLILQFREQFNTRFDGEPCVQILEELLNTVSTLREEIHFQTDSVHRAALQQSLPDLVEAVRVLEDKTRQLLLVLEHRLLEDAVRTYEEVKRHTVRNEAGSQNQHWQSSSSGIDTMMVQNDNMDSWETSRSNVELSLVSVMSKTEGLSSDKVTWLQEMTPFLTGVKSAVEVTYRRSISALTFKMIQDVSSNVALWHSIKYRRDVVFCHAVTALSTAFISQLINHITNPQFLQQILHIGILAEFEGLLSCYGDEMGMIEDMYVAIHDLNNVRFRIRHSADQERIVPRLYTDRVSAQEFNRSAIIVEIPAPNNQFHLLPVEVQRGHLIKVVPVFFNIGLNEQATLAEKFGDSSLQETINEQSMKCVADYYDRYVENFGHIILPSGTPLSEYVSRLRNNILTKRPKNVDILHLSQEICRRLHGMRFTSCKSAKDRTAMAVTLEQGMLLQQRHHMADHHFLQALQCMRSEGVRRENTYKNTGIRKYAFNSLRVLSLPKLYRPPAGTYGNIQT